MTTTDRLPTRALPLRQQALRARDTRSEHNAMRTAVAESRRPT